MVASEQEEVLGILDLVSEQEANRFQRVLSSVYVISQKQIVGFGRIASVLEQPQQVIVLTMDVSSYF